MVGCGLVRRTGFGGRHVEILYASAGPVVSVGEMDAGHAGAGSRLSASMDASARAAALREAAVEAAVCVRCPLAAGRTQVVFGAGNPDAELMLVGEAPGFHEDETGLPFVGQAGQLLGPAARRSACRSTRRTSPTCSSAGHRATETRCRRRSPPASRTCSARSSSSSRRSSRRSATSPPSSSRVAARHHARARPGARGDARHDAWLLPALPPGGGALHAVDADGARAGLRAVARSSLGRDRAPS